jgi:hypothetical protein
MENIQNNEVRIKKTSDREGEKKDMTIKLFGEYT